MRCKRCVDCVSYDDSKGTGYEYCNAAAGFNVYLVRAKLKCGLDGKLYKRKWWLFWRPR